MRMLDFKLESTDLLEVVNPVTARGMIETIEGATRLIPNYPEESMTFRDFTTLWNNLDAFKTSISAMQLLAQKDSDNFNKIVGIEARGWVYASILADRLDKPLALVRKSGKLPSDKVTIEYSTKYGDDSIEMHVDAITECDRVLLIDDLIASGDNALASIRAIEQLGGTVTKVLTLVDLAGEGGKKLLRGKGYEVKSVISYPEL